MDRSPLEEIAEACITAELHRESFLVAKPKPDSLGTDLLAFVEMADGVKFCRIQCKGRSIAESSSSLEIPKDYVSGAFIVILYIEGKPRGDLYCFFQSDIEQWNLNERTNEYTYSIPRKSYRDKLQSYELSQAKFELIRKLIRSAETSGDFQRMVYGGIDVTLEDDSCASIGVITVPD